MTNPVTHGNPSWTAHCRPGKVTTYWRRPSSDDPVPCTAFGCLGIFISTSLHCWVFAVGCVSCELVWTLSSPWGCIVMTDVSFNKRKHQQPRKWSHHSVGTLNSWRTSKWVVGCYLNLHVIYLCYFLLNKVRIFSSSMASRGANQTNTAPLAADLTIRLPPVQHSGNHPLC